MSLLKDSVLQQEHKSDVIHKFSAVQIRSNKLVVTNEFINKMHRTEQPERCMSNLDLKGTVNHIKKSAVARINKILTNWIKSITYENEIRRNAGMSTDHVPVFLTLTLPAQQIHDDRRIKREVLMPFIQDLKRVHGVVFYFWKAELQKNYNIHFHLVIDKFIVKEQLQECWNKHCDRLDYVSRFEKKFKHRNPPSTHVQLIRDLKSMTSYITKYVCKNELGGWIDGQLWNASSELKKIRSIVFEMDNDMCNVIDKLLIDGKLSLFEDEHFAVLSFTKKFDHNVDYKYFRGLEMFDYLKLYEELYNPAVAPLPFQYSAPTLEAPTSRQLEFAFEFESVYEIWH